MSGNELDAAKGIFLEEAAELLEQLEVSLLALEEYPDDEDLVGSIFRALHTIKGSGAMFGFEKVSRFTHEVENAFDLVRSDQLQVNKTLIDLTLTSRDIIDKMINNPESIDDNNLNSQVNEVLAGLVTLIGPVEGSASDADQGNTGEDQPETPTRGNQARMITWRIHFRPARDIFGTGADPSYLLDDLRELGDCTIVAITEHIPALGNLNPEELYVGWEIFLTTDKGKESIEDVFLFMDDETNLHISVACEHTEDDTDEDISHTALRLGNILVARGALSSDELAEALGEQKKIGEILVEKGVLPEDTVNIAIREQAHLKKAQKKLQKPQQSTAEASIRVASSKLDSLVNLVGELVTVQARLTQEASSRKDPQLLFLAEEVERLSNELRDNTMNIRMVPIGTTFGKFRRLVRDLSAKLGRNVALTTGGGETELDKTVIEKLDDPMVHLIRNALDHGIEPPSVRETLGKSAQGTLHLEAEHSGANVLIKIRDDGKGINRDVIRSKAIERGLLEEEADVSDQEIYNYLFAPGFSTAQELSSVSGRGVGMDVVKTNIEALRGSIAIDTVLGEGTVVTLKIPLTLAIIEGLLAKVGTENYILPLANVEECVELSTADRGSSSGRNLINIRGEMVPYIYLRDHFQVQGEQAEQGQIIITHLDGKRIGFVVDEVIGQHQTVIKKLGYLYNTIKDISGTTILGDGSLALILDVGHLLTTVQHSTVQHSTSKQGYYEEVSA